MHIISESEGIARLSDEEREAIAQVLGSTVNINLVHGFRLAALLHKGKTRAAEMAGVMHEMFRDTIDAAGGVINDGDLERGRILAQRNFVDDDALAADKALMYGDLSELYRTAKRIDAPEQFVPINKDDADDMSDSDLAMWIGTMSASLDTLLNEQQRRLNHKVVAAASDANGSNAVASDNDATGGSYIVGADREAVDVDEPYKKIAKVQRRRVKAKTGRAAKSQRRKVQAAKKTRKPRK